jgi:hypothetical protein
MLPLILGFVKETGGWLRVRVTGPDRSRREYLFWGETVERRDLENAEQGRVGTEIVVGYPLQPTEESLEAIARRIRGQLFSAGLEEQVGGQEGGALDAIPRPAGLKPELIEFVDKILWLPEAGVWEPTHWSTQLMLEVMERLRPIFRGAVVLDTGTGSGVLVLNALARLKSRKGVGTDLHDGSIQFAEMNRKTLGVSAEELELQQGDLLEPVRGRTFDVALFNAPNQGLA